MVTFHPPTTRRSVAALGAGLIAAAFARRGARAEPAGTPAQIIGAFDRLFGGPQAGQRAIHAKGVLCDGSFTPAPDAGLLSRAPHLQGPAVPILARFSNFAAVPGLPDGDPASNPRGFAVRFLLPDDGDTDIVAHSYNGFPASTPAEFLAFLRAVADPVALAAYTEAHPAARAFIEHPKPTPASYGTEAYFGVNAFRFSNAAGMSRHGRYRIVPLAGVSHLDIKDAAGLAPDFLSHELAERLQRGPVAFHLLVQLAEEGDPVTDGTVLWSADRALVELGTLTLRALVPAGDERQSGLAFVPTNLVGGIAPSADPMLAARTTAYRLSSERRFETP